ncbi:MAG: PAS domain-containing protein [Saprospiraceae bacterium]|nr:PAS domain-containing protein [Saprospiraceae bacterium]
MNELARLHEEYGRLLSQESLDTDDLDYEWFETQKPFLEQLSKIDHSAITVFDMHRKQHIFASENFTSLFKIEPEQALSANSIDHLIHPDDRLVLLKLGIKSLQFSHGLSGDEKIHYKVINEFRLLLPDGDYVRVIEQHKAFKTDRRGRVWLALSMVDLSPNQDPNLTVLSQLINARTGEAYSWLDEEAEGDRASLTKRESEVLSLVGKGLLSKEISDLLNISVHTVNTHRQRILEKMNANNTIEAIETAKRFGLV